MHTPSDPYTELGVPRDATQAQITHAFRRLLRRYHPDTRGASDTDTADSDSALQRLLAAYSALREAPATTPDPRPETTAPPVVSRPRGEEAPIRAGPIRWTTDSWR